MYVINKYNNYCLETKNLYLTLFYFFAWKIFFPSVFIQKIRNIPSKTELFYVAESHSGKIFLINS